MATTDCTSYYFREMMLRMEFFNERPPWEDSTLYRWSPTEFALAAHSADPGEAGTMATSECSYTGYATAGRATIDRSSSSWNLIGAGTANPRMQNVDALTWGENGSGATIQVAAISIGMRIGVNDYYLARASFTAVDIDDGKQPKISAGGFEVRVR